MKKKNNYVSCETLKKIHSRYIILIGQRANGKSFSVKEYVIKNGLKGEQFGYIRRYKEECKGYMFESYFADILCDDDGVNHLEQWSDGKYNTIVVYRSGVYFGKMTEDNKIERGEQFGYMFGLSWATHYKSLSFPNITTLVYEEFITDGLFLPNEVRVFMNLVSTIFRTRKGRVFMVGNTLSRINPYFREWQLKGIAKQKENSIELYNYKYKDEDKKEHTESIAVYMTPSLNNNSGMFFGNNAKTITSTTWETDEFPHLEKNIDDYEIVYNMVVEYDDNKFLLQLLKDVSSYVWFCSPKTSEIQKNTRVISNQFYMSPYATMSFKPLTENESLIFSWLKDDRIVYSDNLCGTEFKQCYKMLRVFR